MMCVFNASVKLMLYPTTMAAACGNALWVPVVIDTAVQTFLVWATAYLCSRTNKTLFNIIEEAWGRAAARAVYALFALFFALSAIVPMTEQQAMVHEVFYDTIPSLLIFMPFFFFSVYAGSKGLTNAGRTAEICLPVFIVTAGLLVLAGILESDLSALLPLFSHSPAQLASGCAQGFFRFSESAVMLMFVGNFTYKRGDALKISLSCAVGGLIVAAVCVVFYAVYSDLAVVQYFAITRISIFFSAISLIGRTDLVAVYALDIAMLFAIVLYIQMAVYALSKVFGRDWHPAFSLAVNALLFTLTIILNNKFALVQRLGSLYLGGAAVVFAAVMPAVAWIAWAAGGKRREKT